MNDKHVREGDGLTLECALEIANLEAKDSSEGSCGNSNNNVPKCYTSRIGKYSPGQKCPNSGSSLQILLQLESLLGHMLEEEHSVHSMETSCPLLAVEGRGYVAFCRQPTLRHAKVELVH